ncbi:hypothetical protein V8D89_012640 [Ganoderma adspersum]
MKVLYRLFAVIFAESLALSAFAVGPQPGQIKNLVTFGDSYTKIVGATCTVYTLRIGTNDVGADALLTGGQTPGVTLVDTVTCAVDWVRALYDGGARNFVFQNMIPLETVPLYAPDSYPNLYWNARRNTTEWSVLMRELTTSGNANARLQLQLQLLAPTLKGARIGLSDSHSLFADTYARPQLYPVNGTGPVNVTGAAHGRYTVGFVKQL